MKRKETEIFMSTPNHRAMLYEDYIKLRDAKVGDIVKLSDGTELKKKSLTDSESYVGVHYAHPSKYRNLDSYDGTYVD